MNETKRADPQPLSKRATGIEGFDELSGGGLPRNRTTLVMGGPGSGKTVFSLQTLVNAARRRAEAGIFVAFEERSREVMANVATFDWDLPALAENQIYILDAHLSPTVVQSGEFDLSGILAILKAKQEAMNAGWIVFDGIDVLLTLLRDPILEMREIYRIRDWLVDHELTAIVTAKMDSQTSAAVNYGFMQFMVDCVIRFDRRLEYGVPTHRLQVTKYRGSDFASGEFPLSFGRSGIEVAAPEPPEIVHEASTERVSAGFERFDAMLGGRPVPGQQHSHHGSAWHLQDHADRQVCRGCLPARRAHPVRELRRRRRSSEHRAQRTRQVRSVADVFRSDGSTQRGRAFDQAALVNPRPSTALHGDRSPVRDGQGRGDRCGARGRQPAHPPDEG